ncbi:MAG: sarcosine oxidase subunit gamma [Sulfitobacter sp.]
MHDLVMKTAMGGSRPSQDYIGTLAITENDGLALASVGARRGHEDAVADKLATLLGAVPAVGQAVLNDPEAGFWIGPDQWMIGAPRKTHALLADRMATLFGGQASVTDQSGAWVCFDVQGAGMADFCELLCAVPIRKMAAGAAQRTMIHHMNCFVIRRQASDHIRILGPRSSARSLHHALVSTAHAVV